MYRNNQSCRLCLLSITSEVVNIFEKASADCSFIYLINTYFNIEVTDQDKFSKFICKVCAGKLKDFREFSLLVKRNNASLMFFGNTLLTEEEVTVKEVITINDEENFEDIKINNSIDLNSDNIEIESDIVPTENFQTNSKTDNYIKIKGDIKTPKLYRVEFDYNEKEPIRQNTRMKGETEVKNDEIIKLHFETVHNTKAYLKCDEKHNSKQALLLHMDKHKSAKEQPFICKYCDKPFVKHRKHVCNTCGEKFLYNNDLKSHLISAHSKERPYVCEICAREFKLHIYLQRHLFVHNDSFKECDKCGLKFKFPTSYMKHMKAKHDKSVPKSFPCTKCNHTSPTKHAFYVHNINKHGAKKYKCTHCDDTFNTKDLLKRHVTRHTGPEEPITCPYCPKTYRFRSGYYSHKKRAHPND